jgi:hypothetical protein
MIRNARRTVIFWAALFAICISGVSARANDEDTKELIVEGVKVTVHVLKRWLSHHPSVGFKDGKCTMPLALLVNSEGKVEESRISNDIDIDEFRNNARLVSVVFIDVRDEDARAAQITIMSDKAGAKDRRRSLPARHHGYVGVSSTADSLYIGRLDFPGGRGAFFKNNPKAKIELALVEKPFTRGVLLCEDDGYKGMAVWVRAGNIIPSIEEQFGEMNDAVSSIKVYGGTKVTLYQDRDFKGNSKVVAADAPKLPDFNDKASALKVE